MLKINKGEPWLMWPNRRVENFIDFPANNIFNYIGNFSFRLDFELVDDVLEVCTLFAKLPNYCGINVEPIGCLLTLTYEDNTADYLLHRMIWKKKILYKLEIIRNDDTISLFLNNELILEKKLVIELLKNDASQFIFGAGNFPINNENLNYFNVNLYYFEVKKENKIIAKHEFKKFIHGKSFDLSDNCNFIEKI